MLLISSKDQPATNYLYTKAQVEDRGRPSDAFLNEIVKWGRTAPADIFAPNSNPADIYAYVKPILGPWDDLLHRRAVILEVMRVHAGFESSWNWNEGVDTTNASSMARPEREETGAFQVSFDSTNLNYQGNTMKPFAVANGIGTVGSFIPKMKLDHKLAMEYYARLIRISVQWAGPIKRHEIDPWLSKKAVQEFKQLLT